MEKILKCRNQSAKIPMQYFVVNIVIFCNKFSNITQLMQLCFLMWVVLRGQPLFQGSIYCLFCIHFQLFFLKRVLFKLGRENIPQCVIKSISTIERLFLGVFKGDCFLFLKIIFLRFLFSMFTRNLPFTIIMSN